MGNFDNITISQPLLLNYYQMNATQYQYIFGSGEIHVSEALSNVNVNLTTLQEEIENLIVVFGTEDILSNHNVCQDNETLIHMLTIENCVGTRCFTYQRNETEICAFGCYDDISIGKSYCIPSLLERYWWIILIIIGLVIVVSVVLFLGK